MTLFNASPAKPHATLPAATVDGTRDGGLGYDDLKDRNKFTYVLVGPLVAAEVAADNTRIDVLWAGKVVKEHIVTQQDLDAGTFAIAILNGLIVDAGDGDKSVTYTAYYLPGGGEEHSGPTTVTVKRTVPGGLDPHPETPGINENLKAATVSPNPVDAEATEIVVSVPLWINAAAGDALAVIWNGTVFEAPPLTAPFPDPFVFSLTAEQVLDAGTGPEGNAEVTWTVRDVVGNGSDYAPYTTVEVRLEDPGLFGAPRIGDEAAPWVRIDLASLGSADVKVFTPVYDGATAGDSVIVHASGNTSGGEAVAHDTQAQTMDGSGFGLTFTIPNAIARALAESLMRVWYTAGPAAKASHSVRLPVIGVAQSLPGPTVTEAKDTNGDGIADQLDPDDANPAHITIDYPTMALNDTVTLFLDGTAGDGTPVRYQADRQVTTVRPLSLTVAQVDILKFLDGRIDGYYRVVPYSTRRRAFIRALQEQESAHLDLRVHRGSAEQPLPAPVVKDDKGSLIENGGLLDPASTEAVLQTPLYDRIAKGDEITYRWVGIVSTRTQTYKVADAAKPPADYAGRDFIVQNTGGNVVVSYSVRRLGTGVTVPSATVTFQIDVVVPFEIDTSLLTLTDTNPTQGHQASGGVPPYLYKSIGPNVKVTDATNGIIQAINNGRAEIMVSDSATPPHYGTYPVAAQVGNIHDFSLDPAATIPVGMSKDFGLVAVGPVPPLFDVRTDGSALRINTSNTSQTDNLSFQCKEGTARNQHFLTIEFSDVSGRVKVTHLNSMGAPGEYVLDQGSSTFQLAFIDGKFSLWFGYTNDKPGSVSIRRISFA